MMIGDSLAVGVGQARPECETVAKVGITSGRYLTSYMPAGRIDVATAVISLGVNDDTTVDTLENLRAVRARVTSRNVVWLLPGLKPNVRDIIRIVAEENGDRTVDTRPQVGRDHLHPNGTGYQILASAAFGGSAMGEEVASYEPPTRGEVTGGQDIYRPLRRYATPSERVHRLRDLRRAEVFTSLRATLRDPYQGRTVVLPRMSYRALPMPTMMPTRISGRDTGRDLVRESGRDSGRTTRYLSRREHTVREPVTRQATVAPRHGGLPACTTSARSCASSSRVGRS